MGKALREAAAKRQNGNTRQVGLGSSGAFCASLSSLPADPQTSMAATAAVSPSDYLQPAASSTQVSGSEGGGCISLEGLLKLPSNQTDHSL